MKKKLLPFFILLIVTFNSAAQQLLNFGAEWHYSKGITPPSEANLWIANDFDYHLWNTGIAPFRYGDGTGGTPLPEMQTSYTTLFLRNTFAIDTSLNYDYFTLDVNYDDGFIVWINGTIAKSINAPSNNSYNSLALSNHESGNIERFIIDAKDINLKNGNNHIAVQAFNVSLSSSDFYFDLQMEAHLKKPRAKRLSFDTPSGFYKEAFTVTISSEQIGDTILYTLDGSDPATSNKAIEGITPLKLNIDDNKDPNEANIPSVIIRASKIAHNHRPSFSVARTFIFLDKVKTQKYPGGEWPKNPVNNQVFDYEADPDVLNDPRYTNQIEKAFTDIPSISILTDPAHLFNASTGIYVNAAKDGVEWERPASMEIIEPNNKQGIQSNTGLRIRGGASRSANNPKHSFRLIFKDEYGNGKLNYPLFENEGVDKFDKIDLRTSQNYSWSYRNNDIGAANTFTRDVFSRDLQRKMGQPSTQSRYYHLYINGLYWGLYQSQERSEAYFAESYFGGDKTDYDVVKMDKSIKAIGATDGTLDSWEKVWDITQNGYSNNKNYFNLIGCNEAGNIDTSLTKHIEIDNLIDYMTIIFYTGNIDAPINVWTKNKKVNNFYTINNKTRKREGFRFFCHDSEHTLHPKPVSKTIGLYENRVNIGFLTNDMQMTVSEFSSFNPQWLHFKLMENEEFRMRFIDRTHQRFYKEKLFHPDTLSAIFMKSANMLQYAIIAESLRWGDAQMNVARTKDDDWVPAINAVVNDYFPFRAQIVIDQLKEVNWYPELKACEYYRGNTLVETYNQKLTEAETLTLKNSNNKGTIYYTTDGSDPRLIGGAINAKALSANSSTKLEITNSTIVKARIKEGNNWSAINEIRFLKKDNLTNIKITEIHYNPQDNNNYKSKQLEFIEMKNTDSIPLNLSSYFINGGIQYTFNMGTILYPNEFAVLASHGRVFEENYGLFPTGEFKGHLSNEGDAFSLIDKDMNIGFSMAYYPTQPWSTAANGGGKSLVATVENPTTNPKKAEYWHLSKYYNGSPFANDTIKIIVDDVPDLDTNPDTDPDIVPTETRNQAATDNGFINIYPNPAQHYFTIDYHCINKKDIKLQLYDLNGRLITSFNKEGSTHYKQQVNTSELQLKPGLYIIKVISDDQLYNHKLIVK